MINKQITIKFLKQELTIMKNHKNKFIPKNCHPKIIDRIKSLENVLQLLGGR